MGEAQHLAGAEVRCDLLVVDGLLELIGQQHHDPVGLGAGVGDAQHFQAIGLGLLGRAAACVEPNYDVDAAVLEVQGVGMALGAVANDGNRLAVQQGEVGVGVVVKLGHPGCLGRSKAEFTQTTFRPHWGWLSPGRSGHTP